MRTTSPARAARPVMIIAAIAALAGAIACSDVTAPATPSSAPTSRIGVPNSAAASGYALASGKSDTTTAPSSKNH